MIIYKYDVFPTFELELPLNATPLKVGIQNGEPKMWILLEKDQKVKEVRHFISFPTGGVIQLSQDKLVYIDTFFIIEGVFHVFEVL